MTEENDDIDLAALSDDDLVSQMHDDLYDGLGDEIVEGTTILLDRGWSAEKTLNDALVEGMRIVGIDFRDGILFVPEVLLAANAMKAGMEVLRPLLAETGVDGFRVDAVKHIRFSFFRDWLRHLRAVSGRARTHERQAGPESRF